MLRDDNAKERKRVGIVDAYRQNLPNQPRIAIEDRDAVAHRTPCELNQMPLALVLARIASAVGTARAMRVAEAFGTRKRRGDDRQATGRRLIFKWGMQVRVLGPLLLGGPLARPFYQDFNLTPDERLVVFFADGILNGQ